MYKKVPGRSRVAGAEGVRPAQDNIPQTRRLREALRRSARNYVQQHRPVPPLSMEELSAGAAEVVRTTSMDPKYADFAKILLNNEVWGPVLAAVPFDRRLLLLPQCLRDASDCKGRIDEFGLVCARCGACVICDLQRHALELGYVVLVAEGSAVVTSLIETGKVQAVVGVSCMAMLGRVFPHMQAAAIPGVALPLLYDGCADTAANIDWVIDAIYLTGNDESRRLDLDALREEVDGWFTPEGIRAVLGAPSGQAEQLAHAWLAGPGKRWRPFLAACTFRALRQEAEGTTPPAMRRIALAVECFHKASLIHDDIEDGDATRYGEKTLHEQYGVPIALNVGDLLLGLGYHLIASSDFSPSVRVEMLRTAAAGHHTLCLGQGGELQWLRRPGPLLPEQVLDIFRRKTAPAFEVALHLGSIAAGADESVLQALSEYSEHLGIAYQIRDDLMDLYPVDRADGDAAAARPSILPAVAYEQADDEAKRRIAEALSRPGRPATELIRLACEDAGVLLAVRRLLNSHKNAAIRALRTLQSADLKGLLRRVVRRIFSDVELMDWCVDYETGHAAGRGEGEEPPV